MIKFEGIRYLIYETTEYLEVFLRNMLLNENNELHNRNLHISGILQTEIVDIDAKKVDIQDKKVDIETKKVDIENLVKGKTKDFTVKTKVHIKRLFAEFGFDAVFGRSSVVELLDLQNSSASKLISKLLQAEIIEQVTGYGKGKYKFKK